MYFLLKMGIFHGYVSLPESSDKIFVALVYALKYLWWEVCLLSLLYFGFREGCGTQHKQETILDSHGMSGATCFCCQKVCVCVFRKGCEIPCYFNLQFFHAFPVDGKVSMIFQDVSILFENFHFILPPTLNFSKWESLPQCHWQLVVIQLQVLAVRWACSIKYS